MLGITMYNYRRETTTWSNDKNIHHTNHITNYVLVMHQTSIPQTHKHHKHIHGLENFH